MRNTNAEGVPRGDRRFYSVAEVARMFGMSSMTLYREIADERFPAIRIRTRLFVPAMALDEMAEAAMARHAEVSAAEWVMKPGDRPSTMPTTAESGDVVTGGAA